MPLAHWKVLTCALGAGLIGIVVYGQGRSGPTEPEGRQLQELPAPIAAAPSTTEQEPSAEPTPVPIASPLAAMPAPIVLVKPDEPVWIAPAAGPLPPEPTVHPIPQPELPRIKAVVNVEPPPIAPDLPTEQPDATSNPPLSPPQPQTAEPPVALAFRVHVEMVGNATQIELRQCADAVIRVQSDSLDLSTPSGMVNARGKVHVTWSSFQADCKSATMNLTTGAVRLEGDVRIQNVDSQSPPSMSTESLSFNLDTSMCPIGAANGKTLQLPAAK